MLHGSTATIQIESPGDRTYEDLYTIDVGKIRMDVYRNNSLYWSGALDPEFYEEPYERARHYVVSLTFSDFGILGRLKYNLSEMQPLHAILVHALQSYDLALHAVHDFGVYLCRFDRLVPQCLVHGVEVSPIVKQHRGASVAAYARNQTHLRTNPNYNIR